MSLTCHATELCGPSLMIWRGSVQPSQELPYDAKAKQIYRYAGAQHKSMATSSNGYFMATSSAEISFVSATNAPMHLKACKDSTFFQGQRIVPHSGGHNPLWHSLPPRSPPSWKNSALPILQNPPATSVYRGFLLLWVYAAYNYVFIPWYSDIVRNIPSKMLCILD